MDLIDSSFDLAFIKWIKTTETALAKAQTKKGQLVTDPYDHPSVTNTVHAITPPPRWISSTVRSTRPLSNGSRLPTETALTKAQTKKGQLVTDPYDHPSITIAVHAITPPATMDLVDGSFDLTFVKWVKTTMTLAKAKKGHCLRWISLMFPSTSVKWVKTTMTLAEVKKGHCLGTMDLVNGSFDLRQMGQDYRNGPG
ncbi:hypothetical protein FNAPI_13926 [Fusarium napiforme]|uniref:Uncharacterized protein n=1 Tax=Fusarium napiforme TaxID=42672 RepID=A0A8H5I343_9HYPO|nr:hypothetical protein FNAPI_13926 [Fusarium napiforme]